MVKIVFKDYSQKAGKLFVKKVSENMQNIQNEYIDDMRETLSQTPHGRFYKNAGTPNWYEVSGPGPGVHRASKPGEPPAELTGRLKKDIESIVLEITSEQYKGRVQSNVPYSALLEIGGINEEGYKVDPRPAWLPTLVANRKKYGKKVGIGFKRKG